MQRWGYCAYVPSQAPLVFQPAQTCAFLGARSKNSNIKFKKLGHGLEVGFQDFMLVARRSSPAFHLKSFYFLSELPQLKSSGLEEHFHCAIDLMVVYLL
jgi:hypothetical protein